MSGRRGSNPRPSAWKADALPTELLPHKILVGAEGVEPATPGVTGRYSNQLNYRTNVQTFEPMEGVEPTTPRLQITCSGQLSYIGGFAHFFEWGCKDITFCDTPYRLLIIFSASSAQIGENRLKVFPSLSITSSNMDLGLTHTPRSPYMA